MKEKIVKEIIRLGKEHRRLRMPALVAAALFLVSYHGVRNFFLQFRYHPVRQRILVGILILALLAGQIGMLNVMAEADAVTVVKNTGEEEAGGKESRLTIAFFMLPDAVREQTVPVGTVLEELDLPDRLSGVLLTSATDDGSAEEAEDPAGDQQGTEDPAGSQEGTGNPAGDQEGSAGSGESSAEEAEAPAGSQEGTAGSGESSAEEAEAPAGSQEGTEDPAGSQEGVSGSGESSAEEAEVTAGSQEGTENPAGDQEGAAGSRESSAEEAEVTAGSQESTEDPAGSQEGTAGSRESSAEEAEGPAADGEEAEQETRTVTMPAYQAKPVIAVKTLEKGAVSGEGAEEVSEVAGDVVILENIRWQSRPAYDGETEGVYTFTPILPEDYVLAEGVSLPEIVVTVQAEGECQVPTAAGELFEKIRKEYFGGLGDEEIYGAILAMDEDARLSLTAAYEELIAAMTEEDEADEELRLVMEEVERGIGDAAAKVPVKAPVPFKRRAAAPAASGAIALKKVSGSGNAFVYHSFRETTVFATGETYAFLNGVYGYDDAVSSLGSGAILQVTDVNNGSLGYIRRRYGTSAEVKVYVDVVTRGKDFDHCVIGGLYQVPDSGTPTEYRYFCGYGGAQNCGPYYAYTYVKESLTFADVSASLNNVERQGSTDPKDYTVLISYDGGKSMVLDAGSYTIKIPDPDSDEVIIIVSDSEGNSITAHFREPLAVRYENGQGVSNVPRMQAAWKGEAHSLSSQEPLRTGYRFTAWKDVKTAAIYAKGQKIPSMTRSLLLQAQWKDVQAPEISYVPIQVMTRTTDAEVKALVEGALTITDNEPVDECRVEVLGSGFAMKAGNRDVTVKVTDKAGNVATKICTINVSSLVEFSKPAFAADTKGLSVILKNPGTDAITDSGFVWGIMNAPSLTINNGKQATGSPVAEVDGVISVTADNLQKGVNYYARAYVIAGGEVYYSEEIPIGLGLPAYGTFTIKNNGNNVFTVTRSGGDEGEQKVYYRTVNGSAVGGTHFTHQASAQASALTFAPGETSKTITIAEQGANAVYSGKPATAYTNADRTYSVELYRVTGGGVLGADISAGRVMTKQSAYTVDRNVYTYKEETVRNSAGEAQWGRVTDAGYREKGNPSFTFQMPTPSDYLKNTASAQALYLIMDVWEEDDGNQWIKFVASDGSVSEWKFEIKPGDKGGNKRYNAHIPSSGATANDVKNFTPKEVSGNMPFVAGEDYLSVPLSVQSMEVRFDASGSGADDWRFENTRKATRYVDVREPQLVGVAPMAGGQYKAGDSFTVSLIFDEIVDSRNSGSLGEITVNTTWGQAKYAGGADTNVLYFTGTIATNAESTLKVNGFTNADRVKDMCDNTSTTATASGGGNTTATVDTARPNLTVTPKGIAGGTGTVNVVVNADQSKTNSLRYAWSDTAAIPAAGWVNASAAELSAAKDARGLSLSIRKEPGSGSGNGKWYLHVIGTYDTTGATDYQYACVDFGTKSAPAAGSEQPALLVSTDNSTWAEQRTISVQTKGSGVLQYRKSGASAWESLAASTGSVTVTENGWYTFRLTAADNVLTQNVQVEKIDRVNPTASIGELLEGDSNQTPKAGVYTKLTLPVRFADNGSGVKKVEYAWTNTSGTPAGGWQTLASSQTPAGAAQLSYTAAAENAETTKYLHLKVTDQLNHTFLLKSAAYRVISQQAVNNHVPRVTLTGAPTTWTNDMVTLTWTLTNEAGKNYEVILPDGKKAGSSAGGGEVWAKQNGLYTVKVVDRDYGGESTAVVNVQYIDTTAPTVTPSAAPAGWQQGAWTVTFSADDDQSGIGKKYYKLVSTDAEIPAEGLEELVSDSVRIDRNGVWYIYYKFYDQAGDDAIGREGNKTEGFVGPIRIDVTNPVLTVEYGTAGVPKSEGLPVSVKAEYGMSGGSVQAGGVELAALTAAPADRDGRIHRETTYQVTEKGTYDFVLTDGSGKTAHQPLTIYEAAWESGTDIVIPAQLVAADGRLVKPDDPERRGFTFKGWYTAAAGGRKWDFDVDRVTADTTLYARWLDETPPDAPVLKDGVSLPEGWTNAQTAIPLTLHDSVGVAELWVSIDGGSYEKVAGYAGTAGDAARDHEYAGVAEGMHTYRFKAKDAAGNESAESEAFEILLDTTKPAIGELAYENKVTSLWQYVIGKKSMIIRVPVTETGSGAEEISYTMTPEGADGNLDGSRAKKRTAAIRDGEAQILFPEDFKGTILITCEDAAGNAADTVTVSAAGKGGVIVEDTAPTITVLAHFGAADASAGQQPGGAAVSGEYYDSVPELLVTVKDDVTAEDTGKAAVTAGIASVTYQVAGGAEKQIAVDASALRAEVSFSIPAAEMAAGVTTITIIARDNAGNEAVKQLAIKVRGQEKVPAADVDYRRERLKNLVPKADYLINGIPRKADEEGSVPIADSWFDTTVNLVKKGSGSENSDSDAQSLSIPGRPQKPAPTGIDVSVPGGTGKLTGLTAGVSYETSADGGDTWESRTADGSGEIAGLAPGRYVVRVKAGMSNFAGENSDAVKIGAYQVKVTFMVNGAKYKEVSVDYGGTLTEIPLVPPSEDAGDQILAGEWCGDAQGTPAVFTNIVTDMTVHAFYRPGHTVTLQGGAGCSLSALPGSVSPVKEGGSFGFCLAVNDGWQKTGSFAVRINGVKVKLTEEGTYTIENIRENIIVTTEGIERVPEPANPPKPVNPPEEDGDKAEEPGTPEKAKPSRGKRTEGLGPEIEPGQEESGESEGDVNPSDEKGPEDTEPDTTEPGSSNPGRTEGEAQVERVEVQMGSGTVIVTVVCEEQKCTAAIADIEAVAEAVLTPGQRELVNSGETIEIRIDVADISDKVPTQDREVIEKGIQANREEIPGLSLGAYIDISMFVKVGAGNWNAVTETGKPIEVILDIPEQLRGGGREYYVIRAHGGEHTFMRDLDDAPDTITIRTDAFSSYAIAYAVAEDTGAGVGHKCGLCRICPTFLGICCFIWLAILLLTVLMGILLWKRKGKAPSAGEGHGRR